MFKVISQQAYDDFGFGIPPTGEAWKDTVDPLSVIKTGLFSFLDTAMRDLYSGSPKLAKRVPFFLFGSSEGLAGAWSFSGYSLEARRCLDCFCQAVPKFAVGFEDIATLRRLHEVAKQFSMEATFSSQVLSMCTKVIEQELSPKKQGVRFAYQRRYTSYPSPNCKRVQIFLDIAKEFSQGSAPAPLKKLIIDAVADGRITKAKRYRLAELVGTPSNTYEQQLYSSLFVTFLKMKGRRFDQDGQTVEYASPSRVGIKSLFRQGKSYSLSPADIAGPHKSEISELLGVDQGLSNGLSTRNAKYLLKLIDQLPEPTSAV